MGDINLTVDVDGANRVGPALTRGLREGLKDAGNWMLDSGEDKAKDAVLSADRVWRKTLKQGFSSEENQFSRSYHWQGKIENDAPHAKINEDGLKPGNSPSIQDIIPWVDDNLTPNAEAQETANKANIGNWEAQLQALAVEYSKGMVITTFAVKGGLEEDGYPGIGFMETTEKYLSSIGPPMVKNKVEKHMQRELRKAGLT